MNDFTDQLAHKYVRRKGNYNRRMSGLELSILPQLRHDDTKLTVSQREKSESEQLTIFYAGTVHVYDNIAVEKAESILNLALETSKLSAPINAKEIKQTQKSQLPSACMFQADLPIATRKSLKRFFEKRHNRIKGQHPYASPECVDRSGNDNLKEKEIKQGLARF